MPVQILKILYRYQFRLSMGARILNNQPQYLSAFPIARIQKASA